MSRAVPVLLVDVFTDRPFAGNPAGVVLDADGLSQSQMERIAAELGRPGTAFVSSTMRGDAHLKLRMFTPRREVTYSGHTSLAAAHALAEVSRLPSERVSFDIPGGILHVEVDRRSPGPVIWMEPPLPSCAPFGESALDLLDALGLASGQMGTWAQPALTPEADLLLPVSDLQSLWELAPDLSRLGQLAERKHLRGVCLVSLETVEPASATHSRFFAPHYGIPEDIVTGSVHSSLGVWLLEAGRLSPAGGRATFIAEQGDGLGRPGRLTVDLAVAGGRAARVRIGGRAVTVLSGSLRLD